MTGQGGWGHCPGTGRLPGTVAHPASSALSISPPILAAKTTSARLPGWTVPRPQITELIAQGTRWSPLRFWPDRPERNAGACGWRSPRGWARCCRCTATG